MDVVLFSSLKVHKYWLAPEDVLMKFTFNGGTPTSGEAVKDAWGGFPTAMLFIRE